MPEIPRNRDCYVLVKGDTLTVTVGTSMVTNGWLGGQGVTWVDSAKDELTVGISDGRAAGFLLWGSDEVSDKFTAITQYQPFYKFAVIGTGDWVITTQQFERYTYASRQAGPLVELTYSAGDRLVFSKRGLWTKEDEWTLSADPRGANTSYIGYVAQTPSVAARSGYMTIQVMI